MKSNCLFVEKFHLKEEKNYDKKKDHQHLEIAHTAHSDIQEVNCFERHYKKMPGERSEKRSKNETLCQELVLVNYEGSSGKI